MVVDSTAVAEVPAQIDLADAAALPMAGITALRTLRSRSILGRRVLITGAADGTNHQGVIDADTRLVVAVGRPLPGNRNDCKTWELSGAKEAVGKTTVIAERRLPGHRPGHPAPPRARPSRTPGLESPRPRRAHLHPDEGLEDPPRLPTERRRCPPRHARNPPPVQPRPRRVTQKPAAHPTCRRSFRGQPLARSVLGFLLVIPAHGSGAVLDLIRCTTQKDRKQSSEECWSGTLPRR